jgi:ketosteroid isomerase-like protein
MKGKIIMAALLVISGLIFFSNSQPAQANIEPVLVVDNMFTAINVGDVDRALAAFAEDASAENKVRLETYQGINEIEKMLQGMHREGRVYEIVELKMNGDVITMNVEISDRGYVWGTETFEATVKDGTVQTFKAVSIRLELWRIRPNRGG